MIRPATSDDARAIAVLMTQLGYEQNETTARQRLAANDGAVLVFVEGDAILGCIQLATRMSLESGAFGEIAALVVDEAARGRKIGARLVDAAVEWAREQGFPKLRVRTNVVRGRAHQFYESNGFQLAKSQRVYDRDVR
ncbi:MAG TPA: GNAT family N-acetyltransferase [Thermoanaerobaculia bacterium]|nr:GNAT family N-acetyltransferase [Thermoanaerobaculia bacterium]